MATEQEIKQSGFTLFPTPPTPPARMSRSRLRRKAVSQVTSSGGSLPPLHELLPYPHGDLSADDAILRDLRSLSPPPTSMQITRNGPVWDQCNSTSTGTNQTYDGYDFTKSRVVNVRDRPTKSQSQLSRPANRSVGKHQPVVVPLRTPIEPTQARRYRRPSTSHLSQLIDAKQGEIDHKKLSMYLGSALNSSFEMPDLSAKPEPLPETIRSCCLTTEKHSDQGTQPAQNALSIARSRSAEGCKCRFGAVICQCSSSAEFQSFKKSRPEHRPQSSVSSNRCLVNIPRARFKTVFLDIEIPESLYIPNIWSPPALSYSSDGSKESESLDWSTPPSPIPEEGPFDQPRDSMLSVRDQEAVRGTEDVSKARARSFFRRPFLKLNTTGGQTFKKPGPKVVLQNPEGRKYLGSVNTLSTFHLDLDTHAGGNDDKLSRSSSLRTDAHQSAEAVAQKHALRQAYLQPQSIEIINALSADEARLSGVSHNSNTSCASWVDSSVRSSSFEVIEQANTAVMAQAAPAKAVMVMNKQNSVISHRVTSSPSKQQDQQSSPKFRELCDEAYYEAPWTKVGRTLTVRNPDRIGTATSLGSIKPRHEVRPASSTKGSVNKHTTRIELGTEHYTITDRRRMTSNGSPVLGQTKFILVSQ